MRCMAVGRMTPARCKLIHHHSNCPSIIVNRFALKCLDKKRLKLKKGEDVAINERNILLRVSSPFIVNMYYCFQSPAKLFFVLDLMNGTTPSVITS